MSTPEEPKAIKKLDPDVVNRIAAGEIIKRPANALKEMLENSLDAKASSIQVSVKYGGLKFLQIQDNGTGIRKEDLEIVCERFTTSKLKAFEDLSSIQTFGFRGEALASISHIAHLSILTKTASEKCAYKATYADGRLKNPVKPHAGNQGTQITVEDLFYNIPQRKQMFKSPSEEFHRISDVISKYAVHNANVAFSLKKVDDGVTLRTPVKSTPTANINILYGAQIAKELMPIEIQDEQLQFEMNALTTNVKYSSKKMIMLLFINHRLVESTALKLALEQVYSIYLPKGSHPFIYINLLLESSNVDVNVHPTKHEVNFLHEDEIIERIKHAFENKLVNSSDARTFYTQQLLPGASNPILENDKSKENKDKPVQAKDIIRSDAKSQKLEKFFGQTILSPPSIMKKMKAELNAPESPVGIAPTQNTFRARSFVEGTRKPTKLTSILTLRKRTEDKCHKQLRRILGESVFVGSICREVILIQHETNLYLCNVQKLSEELFYQLLLYDFENFGEIKLEPPLSIKDLAKLALDCEESGWCEEDGDKDCLAQNVLEILMEKAPILREYYKFKISCDGYLESLPLLLDHYKPPMGYLPLYLLRLATEVDWETEKSCFDTFSRETAVFYSCIPQTMEENEWKWILEHIFYASIKIYVLPPPSFQSKIVPIASLSNLYKVFERC